MQFINTAIFVVDIFKSAVISGTQDIKSPCRINLANRYFCQLIKISRPDIVDHRIDYQINK